MMGGAFTVDGDFHIRFSDKSLTHALFGQLLEALQQSKAYRICDHCGRPFAYTSERATYCSGSCKTLAWRKRKEEGGK